MNNNCWHFLGSKNTLGYGTLCGEGAHRIAYRSMVGPIGSKHVLHKCDYPPCINPRHLFLGTPKDNTRDMISKGRNRYKALKGTDHWNHKLTWTQVNSIRERRKIGETIKSLCRRYNMSNGGIQKIIYGVHWNRKGE